tara:strand:- start:582 stop:1568 length:987 start_codon:yes stop_codon:yes gene_type:complete
MLTSSETTPFTERDLNLLPVAADTSKPASSSDVAASSDHQQRLKALCQKPDVKPRHVRIPFERDRTRSPSPSVMHARSSSPLGSDTRRARLRAQLCGAIYELQLNSDVVECILAVSRLDNGQEVVNNAFAMTHGAVLHCEENLLVHEQALQDAQEAASKIAFFKESVRKTKEKLKTNEDARLRAAHAIRDANASRLAQLRAALLLFAPGTAAHVGVEAELAAVEAASAARAMEREKEVIDWEKEAQVRPTPASLHTHTTATDPCCRARLQGKRDEITERRSALERAEDVATQAQAEVVRLKTEVARLEKTADKDAARYHASAAAQSTE